MTADQLRRRYLTLWVAVLLLGWGGALVAFPPKPIESGQANLEAMLPNRFGNWVKLDAEGLRTDDIVSADERKAQNKVAEAIYYSGHNQRIMLSLSYGSNQLDTRFNAHRPEYCYQAQGFSLSANTDRPMHIGNQTLTARNLSMHKYDRHEDISYWMTMAGNPVLPGIPRFIEQVKSGLLGKIPDGYLIRISTLKTGSADQSAVLETFANDWIAALSPRQQKELIGD